MRSAESQIQRAYFQWARMHPVARWAFAVPNGGKRDRVTAAIMKSEGVLAGVSDVILLRPVKPHCGLLIEFKAGAGRPTPDQLAFLQQHLLLGYCCAIAWNAELAIKFTVRYLRGDVVPGEIYHLK